MTLAVIFLGFLFGAALQYARLNRFNTIAGMATLDNLTVAKAISVAIGIGAILINMEIFLGFASFHAKPFILTGIIAGGLLFGAGMAILGYCPGTLPISFGEGSLDALSGIFGGLLGGLAYTLAVPLIGGWMGPDLGTYYPGLLIDSNNGLFLALVWILGALFIAVPFLLQRLDKAKDFKWLYAGAGLALLNAVVFLSAFSNRQIGASSTYPYLADLVTGLTDNAYFEKMKAPGHWELLFLGGAFLSGLVLSLIRRDFKLQVVHSLWNKYRGPNAALRLAWAFFGGFILIFGARMAGGCTSGHVISGGMQLSLSSMVFALFVFAGLLITGHLFYKK